MWSNRVRLVSVALASAIALIGSGCAPTARRPLTDAERAAIADTVQRLSREASETFDSDLDCAEIIDRLAVSGRPEVFAAQGRLIEPEGRDEMVAMCRMIKQDRLSAHEEVQDVTVEVLARDAAWVLTRSVYTVRFTDGRTMVRPQVVTTVWSRRPEGWQRVHLHESWQGDGQASAPMPPSPPRDDT